MSKRRHKMQHHNDNQSRVLPKGGLPTSAQIAAERVKSISGTGKEELLQSTEAFAGGAPKDQTYIPVGEEDVLMVEPTSIAQPFITTTVTENIKSQVLLDTRDRVYAIQQEMQKEFSEFKDTINNDYQNNISDKSSSLRNEIIDKYHEYKHSMLIWGLGTFITALIAILLFLFPVHYTTVYAIRKTIDNTIQKALEPMQECFNSQKKINLEFEKRLDAIEKK